jgi:hypothetical protein
MNNNLYCSGGYVSNITTNTNIKISSNDILGELDSTIEFIEFALKLLGLDLTYEEFVNMDESDKLRLIRDSKIKKIIE